MLIKLKKASDILSREITPESVYLNRRRFMAALGTSVGSLALSGMNAFAAETEPFQVAPGFTVNATEGYAKLGPQDEVTFPTSVFSYNNFAEFGPEKTDPLANAGKFKPRPWSITVDGLCAKPGTLDLDTFLKPHGFEYRTYRLRCTETWSIVVPWVGISLAAVVKRFEPLGK